MKKIFSLAIALIATIGIANAQEKPYVMHVNTSNGNEIEYYVDNVKSVTFDQSDWALYATNCSYDMGTYYTCIVWYGTVEGLDLYRNVDDPTQFRLVDYVDEPGTQLLFTYDESTGKVNVPDQDMGYYYGSDYGDIMVQEMIDWMGEWGSLIGAEAGTHYDPEAVSFVDENGVFNFSVAYYAIAESSIGYFGWTSYTYSLYGRSYTEDYEKLTIGDLVSNAPAKKDNVTIKMNEERQLKTIEIAK